MPLPTKRHQPDNIDAPLSEEQLVALGFEVRTATIPAWGDRPAQVRISYNLPTTLCDEMVWVRGDLPVTFRELLVQVFQSGYRAGHAERAAEIRKALGVFQ